MFTGGAYMPINQVGQYLVIYDISEPKRLQRIHRVLKKTGLPIQYSVFSVVLTKARLLGLIELLKSIINEKEDDLRCYRLPDVINCTTLGKQFFPVDVLLFTQGVGRLII